MPYPTGARPSPRHVLAGATPYRPRAGAPSESFVVPPQLDMWGNDRFGCCVTSEEAFAKAVYSIQCGGDELYIDDDIVIEWAERHRVLNGAYLTQVMDMMRSDGIKTRDGLLWHDGPYQAVDWAQASVLQAAIVTGPVKLGVDSGPLQRVVGGENGWILHGQMHGGDLDHCVGLCGYGTLERCCAQFGQPVPSGANPSENAYLMFTWGCIGIVDQRALLSITGEAWVRIPTTIEHTPPRPPGPEPEPEPGPPSGSYQISGIVTLKR